ncbi:unnamed protein product [Symbiodinium sp. CCMP2456]|nr:unnamed protein product [Symbiodinium sp. CCMP2456]
MVTFAQQVFDGPCPISYLRARVAAVVGANQTHPGNGKLALCCGGIELEGFLEVVSVGSKTEVAQNLSPDFWVKSGADLVDRDEPVCRLVALTEPGNRRWSLLLSMSHVIADGYTFYTIHNMLDQSARVWRLEARRASFNPRTCLKDAPFHGKWLFWTLQLMSAKLRSAKRQSQQPIFRIRFVRKEWIEEQKQAFASEPDAPFVSANDLLTSWFFRVTQPSCGVMTMNMRDRMEGVGAEHAGVYTTVLIFFPEEYKSAANIRRAVYRKSPACTLQGLQQCPGWGDRCGFVTSFHTFYRDLQMKGCSQLLHFPSGSEEANARPPFAAIFKPAKDKLVMLTVTEDELPAGPLGESFRGAGALES